MRPEETEEQTQIFSLYAGSCFGNGKRVKISPFSSLTFIDTLHCVGYSGGCQSGSLLKSVEFLGEWTFLP